jgi:hypothetical protein
MKDMESPHKKMQDLCNCFAETDYLKEMALLAKDADKDEAALKWMALAVLHGIDRNAKEITLERTAAGTVSVEAEYDDTELPSPGNEIGGRILEVARQITHIEENKGEIPLALGIRDSNLEIRVKVKHGGSKDTITLKFK